MAGVVARLAGVVAIESWGQNVVVREKGSLVVASLGRILWEV